jgi:hypothetical protein
VVAPRRDREHLTLGRVLVGDPPPQVYLTPNHCAGLIHISRNAGNTHFTSSSRSSCMSRKVDETNTGTTRPVGATDTIAVARYESQSVTPADPFGARVEATPRGSAEAPFSHHWIRRGRVDATGKVTSATKASSSISTSAEPTSEGG